MHFSQAVVSHFCVYLVDFLNHFRSKHFCWCAAGFQDPILQNINPVAVCSCNIQVMNCRNHGYIQRFYQLHQHNLVSNIQMIGGLIQNQCRGLLCKGTGENDSLLFASRQCRKASVRKLLHLNPLQSFLYNPLHYLVPVPFCGERVP